MLLTFFPLVLQLPQVTNWTNYAYDPAGRKTSEVLASALLNHARNREVTAIVPTPFGQNYVVEGSLPTPDGRSPNVRAVWFVANREEIATLATAYPLDA